jgi:translation initiation factor 1
LTTVQGLPSEYDQKKILKALKKVPIPFFLDGANGAQDFACNGTVVRSEELGEVLQFQGDQRNKVYEFLSKTLGMKPK